MEMLAVIQRSKAETIVLTASALNIKLYKYQINTSLQKPIAKVLLKSQLYIMQPLNIYVPRILVQFAVTVRVLLPFCLITSNMPVFL